MVASPFARTAGPPGECSPQGVVRAVISSTKPRTRATSELATKPAALTTPPPTVLFPFVQASPSIPVALRQHESAYLIIGPAHGSVQAGGV